MENTRAQAIGERLRELRKDAGLSQQEVAEKIGVTKMAVSNYEQGIRVPRDAVKVRLADLFEQSVVGLFFT
jgi:transcriptional regulator with XRE-family HTH domain